MSLSEVQNERDAQAARWGNANDDKWSPGEWAALVAHYAGRQCVGDLHAIDLAKFRADMVKASALALACVEAIDRKQP